MPDWTEEDVALLEEEWPRGTSATKIARMLGDGFTKNAVISKRRRLGLPERPSPIGNNRTGVEVTPEIQSEITRLYRLGETLGTIQQRTGVGKKRISRLARQWGIAQKKKPAASWGVKKSQGRRANKASYGSVGLLADVRAYVHVPRGNGKCQFIAGEPTADAEKCGESVRLGSSYCPFHHSICWYTPEKER